MVQILEIWLILGPIGQQLPNILKFAQDGAEKFWRGVRCSVLDFDGDLFDFQHIFGKPGDFIGMEHQWLGVVRSDFRVELFGMVFQVEMVGIGVGISVHRGTRSLQCFFDGIDIHESEGKAVGRGVGSFGHAE
jgi:hypothetical protein